MFKKLFIFIVAATFTLGMTGNAFATFADLELIRIYYDRAGAEIATDLGSVSSLVNSATPTATPTTTIPGSFGSLTTGFAVYFALDRTTSRLWASGSTTVASLATGSATGLTSMKSGTSVLYPLLNSQDGTNYTGLASEINSYKNRLSATQGNMASAIAAVSRLNTEADLTGLIGDGSGSVTQNLYFWANANTTVKAEKIGVPVATITTNFDGSTTISPPPPTFVVNFTNAGNGTLTGTASQTIFSGASSTAVTAVPATGYHFVNWTGAGGTVISTNKTLTVSNVTTDQTITANFAIDAVTSYAINFVSDDNGTITGTPSQTVNSGASTTAVEAVAATTGYHFVNWTGTGGFTTTVTNPLTVTNVTSNQTITANFAIDTFAVTPNIGIGATNGTITPLAVQTINYNGSASFTVTPTGSYIASVSGSCGGTLAGTIYTTNPVTADCTVIANFSQNNHTVSASAGANGAVNPATQQVADGAIATITITPANGYDIATVTGCGGSLTGTSYSTAPVTTDCSVTATFSIKTFALNFTSGGNGTLTGSTSQSVGIGASATAVSANHNAGYHFVNWTGTNGFTSISNPLTITSVTAAQEITANFAIDTYTLSFVSGGNGSLTGVTRQILTYGASASAVTAVPASGYYFVNWSDGANFISSSNPLTVSNVTAAQTITANFALIPPITFTVSPVSGPHGSIIRISPSGNGPIDASATASFEIKPDSGYQIATVTGTGSCNGTLNRSTSTYTTAGILGNCTVEATFIAIPSVALQDALKALRFAIGLETPNANDIASGDVAPLTGCVANTAGLLTCTKSPDGKIDIADVVAIMQKSVNNLSW
ncbi:MAG: beta strand repeat-containing protein [Desulfuromonadaceae bacterium]